MANIFDGFKLNVSAGEILTTVRDNFPNFYKYAMSHTNYATRKCNPKTIRQIQEYMLKTHRISIAY